MNCIAFERNSKVHYRVHKSTSHVPVLHKINPVQADQSYLCKIIINVTLSSTSSFSFRFTHQILCTFPFSPTCAICHVCYWVKIAPVWYSSSTHRYMVRSTVLKDVSFICVHVCVYVYFQWGIYIYMCIYIYMYVYQRAYATWYFVLTLFKKKPCHCSLTACIVSKPKGIIWYICVMMSIQASCWLTEIPPFCANLEA